MKTTNTIRRTTERTYEPTINPHPHYEVKRCVTIRKYVFDVVHPITGEIINNSTMWWKHDTDDDAKLPKVYRGCSYRFTGYNPMPVTDWFHGVPIGQMEEWCDQHNLVNMRLVSEYKTVTYADVCTWDECNMEWVVPTKPRRARR